MSKFEFSSVSLTALLLLLMISGLLVIFSGCGLFSGNATARKEIMENPKFKILENGYEAFRQEDFEKAAQIFEYLYQPDSDSRVSRLAHYGLACARLILAENTQQLRSALDLWQKWADDFQGDATVENPGMLNPALSRLTKSVEDRDARINKLRDETEALKEKIDTLSHQIKQLEAIDQKIEQKKKELSSSPPAE